jgi:hypothetical protein
MDCGNHDRGKFLPKFADVHRYSENSELRLIRPRKLVVSHADNHLFRFTVVSNPSVSIPSCLRWSTRPRLLLYFTHCRLCTNRSQWRSVSVRSPRSKRGRAGWMPAPIRLTVVDKVSPPSIWPTAILCGFNVIVVPFTLFCTYSERLHHFISPVCARELHLPIYPRYSFIALGIYGLTTGNQERYYSNSKVHGEVTECPGIF